VNKGDTPVLWLLIRFYGYWFDQDSKDIRTEDAIKKQLETFAGVQVYPTDAKEKVPLQDYRVPFLVSLCLKEVKEHVANNRALYGRCSFV